MIAPTARDLMAKGYLPDNLPPVYHSNDVWASFSTRPEQYVVTKGVSGVPSSYSGSKRGNQRRIFSIPHPAFQFDSAIFFLKNWQLVHAKYDRSTGSLSKPKFAPGNVRASPLTLELVHLGIAKPGGAPPQLGNILDAIFVEQRSLINYNALPKVFIDDEGNNLPRPRFAIEAFTSDYDDDDDEEADPFDPLADIEIPDF